MAELENVIKGIEQCLICGIAEDKCIECPYRSDTSCITRIKRDALKLLKGFRSAIEVIENLIEGRSKPLESESDREDMDFYHGTGTADRRDSKIAGMMIALDIIKDTLKDGEHE